MLAGTWRPVPGLREDLRAVKAQTDRPFGVNFVLDWPVQERIDLALEGGTRVVSFFWGDPGRLVDRCHQAGALVAHTVGGVEEARRAADAGVDLIVAQGWEAGGHVRGQVTTMVLVPAVVDAVAPTPVVAAGGIADGRGLAAALALGAAGAWIGTRFLATPEAAAHPHYQRRVVEAGVDDTVYTEIFDLGWPDAPHRALPNATVRAWEAAGRPPSGDRPGEGDVVAYRASGEAVPRYSDTPPVVGMHGDLDALALYAGQSAALVRSRRPAGQVVHGLAAEALAVLSSLPRSRAIEQASR